jgi:spore germination protein KC
MAVDKAGDKIRLAIQFPLAGQLGGPGGGGGGTSGGKSWYVDSAIGVTMKDASDRLQKSLSRQQYYAHRRVIILGEALARDGIAPHVDITLRSSQNRMTSLLVLAKGSAVDVLNADASLEQQPGEMIRELTINSMKNPRTIKHVMEGLLNDGVDVSTPYYISDKTDIGAKGEKKQRITLEGMAVFRDDKLVGLLKGEQAQGLLWAMNQVRRPSLSVAPPDSKRLITIQFTETSGQLKPEIKGDSIRMRVILRAIGHVFENQSSYNANLDNMAVLTGLVGEKLKGEVEDSIRTVQGYGSDPCGFGDAIFRKDPSLWKKIKSDWRQIYSNMEVEVETHINMEHSGVILEPATRGEGETIK